MFPGSLKITDRDQHCGLQKMALGGDRYYPVFQRRMDQRTTLHFLGHHFPPARLAKLEQEAWVTQEMPGDTKSGGSAHQEPWLSVADNGFFLSFFFWKWLLRSMMIHTKTDHIKRTLRRYDKLKLVVKVALTQLRALVSPYVEGTYQHLMVQLGGFVWL